MVLGSGALMASASGQQALQNMSPDPRMLGTLNAVAETCTSIVKTVTPAVSTTIFAIGVRDQIRWGSSGLVHLDAHQPSARRYNTMAVAWDVEEMKKINLISPSVCGFRRPVDCVEICHKSSLTSASRCCRSNMGYKTVALRVVV